MKLNLPGVTIGICVLVLGVGLALAARVPAPGVAASLRARRSRLGTGHPGQSGDDIHRQRPAGLCAGRGPDRSQPGDRRRTIAGPRPELQRLQRQHRRGPHLGRARGSRSWIHGQL